VPHGRTLAEKFWHALVLAYTYITVNFHLYSSINVQPKECSLYNRFCIERSPKMGFWRNFGRGAKIFGGMQWPPIYVVWWKNGADALNTLVCMHRKEITKKTFKKRNVYAVIVIFHPVQCLPPKSLVTPWCMWGLVGDVISRAQFQLNRLRG